MNFISVLLFMLATHLNVYTQKNEYLVIEISAVQRSSGECPDRIVSETKLESFRAAADLQNALLRKKGSPSVYLIEPKEAYLILVDTSDGCKFFRVIEGISLEECYNSFSKKAELAKFSVYQKRGPLL